MNSETKYGVVFALGAYGLWGVLPIYFKSIQFLGEAEILVHRIVWSFVFTLALVLLTSLKSKVTAAIKNPKLMLLLLITSILVSANWLIFIWTVANDRMLDASLGYYINPLVNVVFGFIFLGERLRPKQMIAVCLMVGGVMIEIIGFRSVPWVAIVLALTFASYGLLRKKIPVDSQTGLFIETLILMTPALIYWNFFLVSDYSDIRMNSWSVNTLLLIAGPFTSVPLILFAAAAKRLSFASLGFFQYIGPSVMFLLAVFIYGEVFTTSKMLTFGLIWIALIVISLDSIHSHKTNKKLIDANT